MKPSSRAHVVLAAMLAAASVSVFIVAFIVGLPGWIAGLGVAVVAIAVGIVITRSAPSLVLSRLGVHRGEAVDRHERLGHLVEGLCLAGGIRAPELAVLDDPAANAMVIGRSTDSATIVVTSGLLDALDRTELEGVVAHLLARVRAPRLASETLAAVVVGSWLAPIPPLQRRALRWVLEDHPAVRADRVAVSMTRYPPGLISALATIAANPHSVGSAGRATRHLWLDDPVRTPHDAIDIPLTARIDVLQEL